MASKLPVADWGKVHEVEITETDELSGRRVIMRCAGGALELPNPPPPSELAYDGHLRH